MTSPFEAFRAGALTCRFGMMLVCFGALKAQATGSNPTKDCFAKTLRFVVGEAPAESSERPRLVVTESAVQTKLRANGQARELLNEWFDAPIEFHNPLVYRAALDKIGRGLFPAFKKRSKLRPRDLEKIYDHFEDLGEAGQRKFIKDVHDDLLTQVHESDPSKVPARARVLGMSVKDYGTLAFGLREVMQNEGESLAALREVISGGRMREAVEDFVDLEEGLRNPIVYRRLVRAFKGEHPTYAPFRAQKELQDAVESYGTLSPGSQAEFVKKIRERLKSDISGVFIDELYRPKAGDAAEWMGLSPAAYREHLRRLNTAISQQEDVVLDEALHGLLTESPEELSHSMKRYSKDRMTRTKKIEASVAVAALPLGAMLLGIGVGTPPGLVAHALQQAVISSKTTEKIGDSAGNKRWWEQYGRTLTLDDGKQVVFYGGSALAFASPEMFQAAAEKRTYNPITFQNRVTFLFLREKNAIRVGTPLERRADKHHEGYYNIYSDARSNEQGEEFMNRDGKVGKLIALDERVPYRLYIQLPGETSAEAMSHTDRNIYEWRPLRFGGASN